MTSLGYTPSEAIRDDEPPVYDPFEVIDCETCEGRKTVARERADRTLVKRACPTCRGAGRLLRGNPSGEPYVLTIDFCVGAFPCCALKDIGR